MRGCGSEGCRPASLSLRKQWISSPQKAPLKVCPVEGQLRPAWVSKECTYRRGCYADGGRAVEELADGNGVRIYGGERLLWAAESCK